MGPIEGSALFIIFAASVVILLSRRSLLDALIEAIHNLNGGPPSGMHPSPSDDRVLLPRRSRRVAD